jgi:glutathione S-transferase
MKLYTHWSFSPQKVRFGLRELGLHAEEITIDLLKGEQNSPSFGGINPMQKLPVLEDDGFVLWESNAILAYLGEREGKLWPTDARTRADGLRWMFFEARYLPDSVGPLWFIEHVAPSRGLSIGDRLPDGTPVDARVAKARADLVKPLAVAEHHLASRGWFVGDAFSLVDCSLGTTFAALASTRLDWTPYPSVLAYTRRVCERTAWRETNEAV